MYFALGMSRMMDERPPAGLSAADLSDVFDQQPADKLIALVRGVEPVVGHPDRLERIGVRIGFGIEADPYIFRVRIVPVPTGPWIPEPFETDQAGNGQSFLVVQIHYGKTLPLSDGGNRPGELLETLPVFILVRAVGVVCRVVDVDKVGSLHGGDQHDPCRRVHTAQFVDDDPKRAVQGRVARMVLVIGQLAHRAALPPVVGTQKHGVHVRLDQAQAVDLTGDPAGGPAVVPLVDGLDTGQLPADPGLVALGDPVSGLIWMVVQIGDRVADGHPDQFPGRKGSEKKNQTCQQDKLFHRIGFG